MMGEEADAMADWHDCDMAEEHFREREAEERAQRRYKRQQTQSHKHTSPLDTEQGDG